MNLPSDIKRVLDVAARHLGGEAIAAYIDNALTADERQAADNHLSTCPKCSAQLARVVEAVDADKSDPARINVFLEELAVLREATVPKTPAFASLPERVVDELRATLDRTRDWIGGLSNWHVRPAFAGLPMRSAETSGHAHYSGVEASLEMLFAQDVLKKELAWARDGLSLTAAYGPDDRILAIRAVVGCGGSSTRPSPINIRIGPPGDAGATLVLTQDRPAAVINEPPLSGALSEMVVSVSVGAVQ